MDLSQRLDEMELAIHKPSFRKGTGRANEVNYHFIIMTGSTAEGTQDRV